MYFKRQISANLNISIERATDTLHISDRSLVSSLAQSLQSEPQILSTRKLFENITQIEEHTSYKMTSMMQGTLG